MHFILQRKTSAHALGQVGAFTFPDGQVLYALERQTPQCINTLAAGAAQKTYPCIPAGTYDVAMTYSPRFKTDLYLVGSVHGRSGIRLHVANYPHELLGCIALGLAGNAGKNFCAVNSSRAAFDVLYMYTERKPFTLEIRSAI